MAFALPDSVAQIVRPPERLSVSEWADRYRYLDRAFTAEPGPWHTSRTPWLREIQDSFADPAVSSIIFVKGSRIGGSESMNNMLAYSADCQPMPSLAIWPRKPDVKDELTGRLRSVFLSSPRLRGLIQDGNWATDEALTLKTMTIIGAAASTPDDLIRRTIGLAFFDEVDNCEAAAGRLGNVWSLVERRLQTYGYRAKLVGVTTPTTEEGTAWQLYLRSDGRRYLVPCPECGHYQVLDFDRLQKPADEHDADRIEQLGLVRYACAGCEAKIADPMKDWMVTRGVWVPKAQQIVGRLDVTSRELCDRAAIGWKPEGWRPTLSEPPKVQTRHRGYWLSSLYSTLGLSWSQFFADFLRSKDNTDTFRVHVNQMRGEPWKESVVVTDVAELRKKTIGELAEGILSKRVVKLLASADVQLSHLYYTIWGFGPGEESWLVRHGTCEDFALFYEIAFGTEYKYEGDGPGLTCERAAIDTRYRRDEVLNFCERSAPEVLPFFGFDTMNDRWVPFGTEWRPTGGRDTRSLMAYKINTAFFKTKVHRLARLPKDHPGTMHLHGATAEEFFRQFTAEELTWERKKKLKRSIQVWKPKREGLPNHYLDCTVYAFALADVMNYRSLKPKEFTEAARRERLEKAEKFKQGGMRMPDGRPYLVTQR